MPTLKVIAKTTLSHLKEILKGNEEGLEFLEELEKEHKSKISSLEFDNSILKGSINDLENEMAMMEQNDMCDSQIDFGVGLLQFKQPGNLKIQQVMERLTSEYQVNSNHTSIF